MSWPLTRLGDHCEVITKGTTPTTLGLEFADSGIPFLRVQNIANGSVNYERDTLFVDEKTHRTLERSQIWPGDVLVSIAGTIGRAGVVPDSAPALNCNQALAIVRTKGEVFRPFLRHWLESTGAQAQMRGATVTGTISNLSLAQVGSLKLSLPPLHEQRRIAEVLDLAEALRAKRRAALAQLDTLTQSLFLDMFGDPTTNPKGIRKQPLGELIKLRSGDFLPAVDMAESGTYPVLGGNGISGFHDQYKFEDPQIVIGRVGAYCGCIHVSPAKSWITDNALYVSERDPDLLFEYLVHALTHAGLNRYASQFGQPLVSGSRIYPVPILVPRQEAQEEFVARAARAAELKSAHKRSLSQLTALFTSLQHRAFRGEL